MARIWYIDSAAKGGNGLTPEAPLSTWDGLTLLPGDTILLKRGSLFRKSILSPSGEPGAPIVWGAYGEGNAPVISGSLDYSSPENWSEISDGIWEAKGLPRDEICALFFNSGTSFGTLRWDPSELKDPGDWYFSYYASNGKIPADAKLQLLVAAPENPGSYWSDIEVAPYRDRRLASAKHDVTIQDIAFKNAGIHGFAATDTARISILRCRFENIGGGVWSAKLKIRFGNGIEFWNSAEDNRVEDCAFIQIYDSAVTHQGGGEYPVPRRLSYRRNFFACCGMAAYEIRDVIPFDTVFEDNICLEAGTGFAEQGDLVPRRSEIWPQPMGHHLFVWRIEKPTPGGRILIKHNTFGSSPVGSAEYSIIAPEAEAQILIEDNTYLTPSDTTLIRCGAYQRP